ncbi:KAP family P-loop NTPase fold protein [Pantoea agglomerans]|jgi:hypothetical protein|uniref:KAP family P-loop NTPase fold protein n=1 Tax=Enterobacter agglomerans TaxID=549 RepID=UPI003C7D04AA
MNDSELMPSALDKHIQGVGDDAFGHRHFAQALKSLIETGKYKPPYSIGLLGDWGTGKSSIKELYLTELKDDQSRDDNGLKRTQKTHCITYNAWRFGGKDQDVKRTLLRHVFLELGGDEESLKDSLYRQINTTQSKLKSWKIITKEHLVSWFSPFPAIILMLLVLFGFLWSISFLLPGNTSPEIKATFLAVIAAISTYIAKSLKSPAISISSPINTISFPSTSSEQYEEMLVKQIRLFHKGKVQGLKDDGRNCERIVVFVDDLDRLSAEEMVTGLDAIRTFMEIPIYEENHNHPGMIFVISCDERRVADALSRGRKNGDMPGTVFSSSDARRYLDRIFQFRLEIPPFPRQDMRSYALKVINKEQLIIEDLRKKGISLESIIDRMIYPGVQTPRNALQIVNAFFNSWWIAKRRELETNENIAGGLHVGAVTSHPISLGALSALKVNFPDFYDSLLKDPTLIEHFTDILIRKKNLSEKPLSIQLLLKEKYYKNTDEGSEDLLAHHRELRAFLASLIGVKWPPSIQSLLYLSEDSITRKFGSAYSNIYLTLVSGDTHGLLENLGKDYRNDKLSSTESKLIYQMTEDLSRESESRRDNAYRVISEIIDKIPTEFKSQISGQLCLALVESLSLRSMTGLDSIGRVIESANIENKVTLVSKIIEDTLVPEKFQFKMDNLELPTLEDALMMSCKVTSISLDVWNSTPLPASIEDKLVSWIVSRTVNIHGKSAHAGFSHFEEWVNKYKNILLPKLKFDYLTLIQAELNNSPDVFSDLTTSIEQAREVIIELWASGEDNRRKASHFIIDSQSVMNVEFIEMTWDLIGRFNEEIPDDLSNKLLSEISSGLISFVNASNEKYDIPRCLELISNLMVSGENVLDGDTCTNIENAIALLGFDEVNFDKIESILDQISMKYSNAESHVYPAWFESDIDEIPEKFISYVAANFSSMDDAVQTSIISYLNKIISQTSTNNLSSEKYKIIMNSIKGESRRNPLIVSHVESAFNNLNAKYSNASFTSKIHPNISSYLDVCSEGFVDGFYNGFISKIRSSSELLQILMLSMFNSWVLLKKHAPSIDFNQLFTDLCEKLSNDSASISYPVSTLHGVKTFIDKKFIENYSTEALNELACKVWRTSPDTVIKQLGEKFSNLTPSQFSLLAKNIDFDDEKMVEMLSKAWGQPKFKLEYHSSCFKELWSNVLSDFDDSRRDTAIEVWLTSCNLNIENLIAALISDEGFDDDGKVILLKSSKHLNLIDKEMITEIVKVSMRMAGGNTLTEYIISERDYVNSLLKNRDDRFDFVKHMLSNFYEISSIDFRKKAASWGRQLLNNDALKFITEEGLDLDDIEYLENIFKGAYRIKTLRKNIA